MFLKRRTGLGRRLRIRKSTDMVHIFYSTYHDDPENRFGGHVLCVTTDSEISERSPKHPDRWVKYHIRQSEPIYSSRQAANSDNESRKKIWLVLMGSEWHIEGYLDEGHCGEEDWESYEPSCAGAAWDLGTAKRIQNRVDQGGNTVVMGFSDGWIYGRDEIPPAV